MVGSTAMKLARTRFLGGAESCESGLKVPAGDRPRESFGSSGDALFSNMDRRLRTAELERCSEDISMRGERGLAGDLSLISCQTARTGAGGIEGP